jgi:hypothetical protein
MKHLLALAALTICTAAGAADVVTWATAVSKQQSTGRAIIFRFAKDFREGFQRSKYPARVILVWRYKSESGMPSQSEREAMDQMEDLLSPQVEGSSILALVSTGENLREWIFYATTEAQFLDSLNNALAGKQRYPIEVHATADPEWSSYSRFRKDVRE